MILYLFFTEVKCKGNTQITNTKETEKHHRVIRLMSKKEQDIFKHNKLSKALWGNNSRTELLFGKEIYLEQ